jgi:hypothetical protein
MSNTVNSSLDKSTTVVTAYYRIKSKHDPRKYDEWIHNLLVNVGKSCKMIIFTSPELLHYIENICEKNKKGAAFTVISIEIKDLKIVFETCVAKTIFTRPSKSLPKNNWMLFDMEFKNMVYESSS